MGIPGGFIADRFLGHYRAVLLGGIIIACGHYCMAVPTIETFYLGLVLIVLGCIVPLSFLLWRRNV